VHTLGVSLLNQLMSLFASCVVEIFRKRLLGSRLWVMLDNVSYLYY
jgi:hypothetical protein